MLAVNKVAVITATLLYLVGAITATLLTASMNWKPYRQITSTTTAKKP